MELKLAKEEWLNKLKNYAMEWLQYNNEVATQYRDCGGWDDYYEDGYTPEEAVREDNSYGD